jgi:hypothetical protein
MTTSALPDPGPRVGRFSPERVERAHARGMAKVQSDPRHARLANDPQYPDWLRRQLENAPSLDGHPDVARRLANLLGLRRAGPKTSTPYEIRRPPKPVPNGLGRPSGGRRAAADLTSDIPSENAMPSLTRTSDKLRALRLEEARREMADGRYPNGRRDRMTPQAAVADEVYVSGAAARRRDPEIRRLWRLLDAPCDSRPARKDANCCGSLGVTRRNATATCWPECPWTSNPLRPLDQPS